ncbi:hypothetical protein [Pseudonocardia adelaidensis]|uniref:Uncharacterized protein n=1 Tax=Pseudonocardia adelaidensis TaxID=648754 RepID=A0ABP9P2X5_9PSEU
MVDGSGNALPGLYAAGSAHPRSVDGPDALVHRFARLLLQDHRPAIGTMLTGTWTADRIADAFENRLGDELEPIGFGGHLVRPGG